MIDESPLTVIKQIHQKSARDKTENHVWATSCTDDTVLFEVTNVKLVQTPSELVKMKVEITKEKNKYQNIQQFSTSNSSGQYTSVNFYKFHIDLEFTNYLHEFNKNYTYELLCNINNSQEKSNECLFSCTVNRTTETVQFVKRFLASVNYDLTSPFDYKNIFFGIRRHYNGCNDVSSDGRIHTAISTLRKTGCDVVLQAKDGVIPTHRSILSQNSEVFQAMFSVEMKEKQSGIIDVSDFEKRVVNKMLDYFYTGEVGELGDMTAALFKLAHRYQLYDLCRRCEEYYTFNVKVDNDNIVEILKLTDLYELENLNKCAVHFAKSHEEELIQIPGYREYLIQSINLDNVVAMLLLTVKYDLKDVKVECFGFIEENYHDMMEREDFLNLFSLNALLMKEIYVYMHKKKL